MRFDGPLLARAWLAVAHAAGQDTKLREAAPQLYKTVAIEEHDDGVRLVATDRAMLLTAWVPDLDAYYGDTEPERALLPHRTVVAADVDGRARSMLGHILSLANRYDEDDYAPGDVEVAIDFDVRAPAGSGAQPRLEGMDPTYVVLSSPDVEKVFVPVYEGSFVDWRAALDSHANASTLFAGYDPGLLERLAKASKHAAGPIRLHLGGKGGTTRVLFVNSDPQVHGLLSPAREDDPSEVECRTCAEGAVCLKHSSGVAAADGLPIEPEAWDAATVHADNVVHLGAPRLTPALLARAAELVTSTQFGSAAMLKRKLGVSRDTAAAVMGELEAHGFVGPLEGTKAREVLVRADDSRTAIDAAWPAKGGP